MARIYLNNVKTRLALPLAAGATTCTVKAGEGALFALATGGNTIRATLVKVSGYKEIEWEIVDVTARSTDTLTIVREREGSAPLDFDAGDVLDVRDTAEKPGSVLQDFNAKTLNAAGLVTVNLNTGTPSAAPTGTGVHVVGANSVASINLIDAYASLSSLVFRRAQGTLTSPSAITSGSNIGGLQGIGYGTTGYSATKNALLLGAGSTWSDTSNEMYLTFQTVAVNETTTRLAMRIQSNGLVSGYYGFGTSLVTVTTITATLADTTSSVIVNYAGTCTLTLPAANLWTGREITVKTVTNNAVVSASSNASPLAGGATGTAILDATAGKWADLKSDGTNWVIMRAN